MVEFPPWNPSEQESEMMETIPAPANFAEDLPLPSPPPEAKRERVSLKHMKHHSSKSMSETITSVDSDSSGRRETEHETSASNSEPLSPCSEPQSPEQPVVSQPDQQSHDDNSSDAFLTAVSEHLTGLTISTAFNTALERSYRGGSDTSHNSTLRMDHPTMDLPYEASSAATGAVTSPESAQEGPRPESSSSSTSGSYSLEAAAGPAEVISPEVVTSPLACPKEFSSTSVPEDAEEDRKALKEGMKLQFAPGATMFHQPATPTRSGRRGNKPLTFSSSDSDEENGQQGERSVRKRRPKDTGKKARNRSRMEAELGRAKRDSSMELLTPGMVRSPAMHEGFRAEDWIASGGAQPSQGATSTPVATVPSDEFFKLQHPSESSEQADAPPPTSNLDMARWLAPSPNNKHLDSVRSGSPGSDSVFLNDTTELSGPISGGSMMMKPPEGFADSPVRSTEEVSTSASAECQVKKKRDSGRGKRTKSCTLPTGEGADGSSSLSLEDGGPQRTVSAVDVMWYPETQLPPKRQLTVRAKSEERDRWSRPSRRY